MAKFRGDRPRELGDYALKKRKHHEHFIRPPVTTVHGRPNKIINLSSANWLYTQKHQLQPLRLTADATWWPEMSYQLTTVSGSDSYALLFLSCTVSSNEFEKNSTMMYIWVLEAVLMKRDVCGPRIREEAFAVLDKGHGLAAQRYIYQRMYVINIQAYETKGAGRGTCSQKFGKIFFAQL